MSERVMVTGGRGFLGSQLCARLRASQDDVHAVARLLPATATGGLAWHQADLADVAAARRVVRDVRPDTIFHLAGFAMGRRDLPAVLNSFRDDLATTVNLLVAATESGCRRIVLAGSLEEPTSGQLLASSPYAVSKAAAAQYAHWCHAAYGTPVATARIFMTYGPGQRHEKLIPSVIDAYLRGQSPRLRSPERPVDWVHVDDVIEGLLALAASDRAVGQTLDLGSGRLTRVREVVAQIGRLLESPLEPVPADAAEGPAEVVRAADAATSWQTIGWRATTPLAEGLRQTVQWYRRRHVRALAEQARRA